MLLSLSALAFRSASHDDHQCANISTSLRVVVGVTCALSMIGSLLIILSYCIVPGIRTKGREILVNLSLMDFVAAASNCTGIAVNFNHYLGNSSDSASHTAINRLCVAQAVFAQYGTISSILWTVCLAVYIYLCIMVANKKIAFRSVMAFYVLCYGLPAIVSAWYVSTGKLGFDQIGGSGWCSVILEAHGHRQLLSIIFTNDIWVYLTMVVVPVIFVALHYHLKSEMRMNKSILTQSWKVTMQNVEVKLLFIPIIFILLRIWSLLLAVIVVEANHQLPCAVVTVFLYIGGVGDSGQGFFNGILYVFFSQKVRSYFLHMCLCCGKGSGPQGTVSLQSDRATFYRSFSSDNLRHSEDRESEYGSDAEVAVNRQQHKSLLLNS